MALYAFDGTWNEQHDAGEYGKDSNVVRFGKAYDGTKSVFQKSGDETVVRDYEGRIDDDIYVAGVGTRHGRVGRFFGGAFGMGGRARIAEARKKVHEKRAQGDSDVDIIGFSRGAALALHFANVLDKDKIPVRFVGIWDVVAAFGIPINLGPIRFQRINLGYHLKLPKNVRYCFHAVALDERRQAFHVTRVDNGYQVWFRGVHSDVGGGNQNEKLSNISLRWMLAKAAKVGLPVVSDRAAIQSDPDVAVSPSRLDPIKNPFRKVKDDDRIHYTVSPRNHRDSQNAPEGCPRETQDDEKNRILTTEELSR